MDVVGSWHCLSTVKDDETWKWHLGFDHLNFKDLRQLSEKGLVSGIPEISISENVCESCIVGKQSRKPFQARLEMRSKEFLDVVYSDICGHMEVSILAGNRYFITFVDEFSRMVWVFLIQLKSEPLEVFKRFKI